MLVVLFIDRPLKVEPLATVASIEKYLLKMVAKQWYDYERSTFTFIKKLKGSDTRVSLKYDQDFDNNGVMYWIGTNGRWVYIQSTSLSLSPPPLSLTSILCSHRSKTDWVNPASHGVVVVSSSDGRQLPYGKLEDILSRDQSPLNCHSNDDK